MKNISLIILYDEEKKILLQDRDEYAPMYPNYWSFFGGQIEKGENPLEGVVRETLEELELRLEDPKLFHEEFVELQGVKMHCYYFMEKVKDKSLIVLHEGKGMGWFHPKDIKSMRITPLIKYNLDKIEEELKKLP